MPNNITQPTVYLRSGSPETENREPDGYSGGQLGSKFTIRDRTTPQGRGYQLVVNDSVMDVAPTAGAVAWWLDRAAFRVTTDVSAAGRGNVAGVYLRDVGLGNVCCIQKKGPIAALQVQTGTASAAGLLVIPSATDGKADVLSAGTAATYPVIGKSTGVAAGSPSAFPADLNVDDGTE